MIGRLRSAPVGLVGLVAVAASCSLTTDLDGLVAEGPASIDAGDSGSTSEGGVLLPDSGVPSDSGSLDAPSEVPFCVREPGHLLCSDFESGSVLDGKWDGTAINGTSTLTREEGAAASGRGNVVSMTGAVSTGETHAVLVKNFTQSMKSMTLAASVKIVNCASTGTGSGSVMSMSAGPATDKWLTSILMTPNGIVMNATRCPSGSCTGSNHTLAVAPKTNVWTRIVMTVDLAGSTATVTVDGQSALDKKPIVITAQNANALVNVGARATAPSAACRIEYDDVTFDAN